jgi:hypothetical protein
MKFKYGQRVVVIEEGFYLGATGVVNEYSPADYYQVILNTTDAKRSFSEHDLAPEGGPTFFSCNPKSDEPFFEEPK